MTYLDDLATRIRLAVPDDALPEGNTDQLFRAYAVLLLAKGEAVSREDVHNAWVAWMAGNGDTSEAMVPFRDLPSSIKAEDSPFVHAIRLVARQ